MDPESNHPQHSQDPHTESHSENLLESKTGAIERVSLDLPTLSNYEFSDTRFRSPYRAGSVIDSLRNCRRCKLRVLGDRGNVNVLLKDRSVRLPELNCAATHSTVAM